MSPRHLVRVAVGLLAAAALAGCASSAGTQAPDQVPSPMQATGTRSATAAPSTPETTPPTASPGLAAGALSPADRVAPSGVRPIRLRIPSIGVNTHVDGMGLNDDGSIEVPTDFDRAGWWSRSVLPGRVGASILLGHVDSTTGPAVFFRLDELGPGDLVHVDGEAGATVTFEVQRVERYPKAEFPSEEVLGATPSPTVRLITCGGAFDSATGHYLDNVVAFATVVVP